MTTKVVTTLGVALTQSNPNEMFDALQQCDLGNMFQVKEWDSGTITAAQSPALPELALAVLSARVVTSGTGASVGNYLVSDSNATPLLPPGGANTAVGIAATVRDASGAVSAVKFPNTVTRVVVQYIAAPKTKLSATFTRS